jgi:ABC-type nitrate/sulfonate/bicarbonate transport system permease component
MTGPERSFRGVAGRLGARTAVVVAVLALVEAGVRTRVISPLFVAPPTTAIADAFRGVFNGSLGGPLLVTLYEVATALVLASVAGLCAGYLLWRYDVLGRAYEPWVAGLFAAPLILLYPIPLVIFGRTPAAVIAQATVMATPPVILYTRQGFAGISPQLFKVAAVYRLSSRQALRQVFVPAAAPTVITGLRLGLTYILVGVISVEYLAEIGGLGKTIDIDYLQFNMAQVYAAVVLVIVVAAALLALVGRLQWMVHR